MTRVFASLAVACWGIATSASAASVVDRLKSLEDRARPVVILSDSRDDPRVARQIAAFDRAKAALAERDVTILREAGPDSALRGALDAPAAGFAVVLVGKDGGVKKVWRDPVDPMTIAKLIDAMPMRQDEMRRNATPPSH
jgi:hypothetical protein